MNYRLSNRQRTNLLVKNHDIQIAIPIPFDWPDDATDDQLREFFLRHVTEVTPAQLRDVTETEVCVQPYCVRPDSMPLIVTRDVWHMVVGVVVGRLSAGQPHRPSRGIEPIQFPGDVRHIVPPPYVAPAAPPHHQETSL